MIKKLDNITINKIAAGEVVERPLSVVKELIENSIDANATAIKVSVRNSPSLFCEVSDNGVGIPFEELPYAFERHATSKIEKIDDLFALSSLGFRGEALPSIASVAYVTAISKTDSEKEGGKIVFDGGKRVLYEKAMRKRGTTVRVENLFFNVPARKKFLKSAVYEMRLIKEYISKEALIFSDAGISFELSKDGKTVMKFSEHDDFTDRVRHYYGKEVSENLVYFEKEHDFFRFKGYITAQHIVKKNSSELNFFVNGRAIKHKKLLFVVKNSLREVLEPGTYPYLFLFLEISPDFIDFNVHPQKIEARFTNEDIIFSSIYKSIKDTFQKLDAISTVSSFGNEREFSDSNDYTYSVSRRNRTEDIVAEAKRINLFDDQDDIKMDFSRAEKKISLFDYKYVDTIFERYLLFSSNEELLFIDFHALNERINYDKFLNDNFLKYKSNIIPVAVSLGKKEFDLIMENKDLLDRFGITIREFGESSVIVETLPQMRLKQNINVEKLLHEIVEIIEKESDEKLFADVIATMACKASFRTGDKLSDEDIAIFAKYIENGGFSLTCPHGRPVIKKIKKYDIDKLFKR